MTEVGLTGLKYFSGHITEELLQQLQGEKAIRVYQEMSDNDSSVGALLFAIDMLVRRTPWFTVPGIDDNEDSEFLDGIKDDMSTSWMDFISEVLSMLVFGWSWFEVVWKRREGDNLKPGLSSHFDDGKIGVKKLAIRSLD